MCTLLGHPANPLFNFLFVYIVEARVRANTQRTTRGAGEGRTKHWGTETLGDLWKGEGWGREHRVYKMDIAGTFTTLHDRELSGRKSGNLKEGGLEWINGGRKDRSFGWGKIRGGGEQLF